MIVATSDPLWYLLVAPVSVIVAALALWYGINNDRKARVESDRRLHSAMFGYVEGGTTVPGIWNVVVGSDGEDGLRTIASEARATATLIANKQTEIEGEVDTIKDMAIAAATLSSSNNDRLVTIEGKVDAAAGLAKTASEKATVAAATTEDSLGLINQHIRDDQGIHEEQRIALSAIGDKVGAAIHLSADGEVVIGKKNDTHE